MRLPLILVLVAGCTTDPTESSATVRDRYVDRHTDTFVLFDRTRTMNALKSVLAEEGWELEATDDPTHFKTTIKHGPYNYECSVTVLELMDKKLLVQIMEIARDEKGEVTRKTQRTDLEWLVAQRAEPDRALALMQKANERADKVPPITRNKK